MNVHWLRDYIARAIDERLCTSIGCTTCGAGPFRQGVADAMRDAVGVVGEVRGWRTRAVVHAVGAALAALEAPRRHRVAWESALSRLLYDLWGRDEELNAELEALLADSWAGRTLHAMKAHHAAAEARRELRDRTAEAVERRRAAKREEKRLELQARTARKGERDRLWRASQDVRT